MKMARLRLSIKQFLIPGVVLYLTTVIAVHILVDDVHFVLTGIGLATFLLAVAALVQAGVKVKEYMDKTDELEHMVNGGLKDHETIVTISTRMDRFERERDDCLEKYDELHRFVLQRLDDSGVGRSEPREAT